VAYFVTGRTGFTGRNLVERLLDREGAIHLLHRPGPAEKVERSTTAGPPSAPSRTAATSAGAAR